MENKSTNPANVSDKEIREAADEWIFGENGMKWSNNDNTAGDNHGSFMAGAKWAIQKLEADKAELLEALENVKEWGAIFGVEYSIYDEIEPLIQKMKQ